MDEVAALEDAAYATWTADEADVVAGWHVTATAGLSRRVNSARDLGDAVVDDRAFADLSGWFRERGLPLVIRETPLMSRDTSAALRAEWRLAEHDETPVMKGPTLAGALVDVRVVRTDDIAFQEELHALNARSDGDTATLRRICGRVVERGAGLWIPGHGVGVAVKDGYRAAVFSLAVAGEHRRRGLGTRLMAAASNWAGTRDVSEIFVQVGGTNAPAIELYRSLGFDEVYRYRYLLPLLGSNEGGS